MLPPGKHINPVLRVERSDAGRVVPVECLVKLRNQRTHLLSCFWIDRIFLLGKVGKVKLPILLRQLLSVFSLFSLGVFYDGCRKNDPVREGSVRTGPHSTPQPLVTRWLPGCADEHPLGRKILSPHLVLPKISQEVSRKM
jgi:hypothetical protein